MNWPLSCEVSLYLRSYFIKNFVCMTLVQLTSVWVAVRSYLFLSFYFLGTCICLLKTRSIQGFSCLPFVYCPTCYCCSIYFLWYLDYPSNPIKYLIFPYFNFLKITTHSLITFSISHSFQYFLDDNRVSVFTLHSFGLFPLWLSWILIRHQVYFTSHVLTVNVHLFYIFYGDPHSFLYFRPGLFSFSHSIFCFHLFSFYCHFIPKRNSCYVPQALVLCSWAQEILLSRAPNWDCRCVPVHLASHYLKRAIMFQASSSNPLF